MTQMDSDLQCKALYVRAHVFSGNIVKLCSSRSSTFQFRVLQMAQQL